MIIHTEFEQGSLAWAEARAGLPTASEFDQLLTPEFKLRTGQMPQSYLARKLAEKWLGGPLPGHNGVWDMEQGQMLEDEAIPFYEMEMSETVKRVGFCTTDDRRVGCSPDGLIDPDGGLECKAPSANTQVAYLLAQELPKDYACQVHGCMYVTGAKWWRFMSYRRHFPPLMLFIERDEGYQKAISDALKSFLARFDEGWTRLVEINGGEPVRNLPTQDSSRIKV